MNPHSHVSSIAAYFMLFTAVIFFFMIVHFAKQALIVEEERWNQMYEL